MEQSPEIRRLLGSLDVFTDRVFRGLEQNPPAPGKLLVSAPDMRDDFFTRTVIYVVQHDETATTGVILNRQSEVAVTNMLPEWAPFCSAPASFYIGGPVKTDKVMGLIRLKPGEQPHPAEQPYRLGDGQIRQQLTQVESRTFMVDLGQPIGQVVHSMESFRMYVGYCSWVPGQLDGELDRGDWFVADSVAEDFGTDHHTDLYGQVLRRQGVPLRLYATRPVDPMLN